MVSRFGRAMRVRACIAASLSLAIAGFSGASTSQGRPAEDLRAKTARWVAAYEQSLAAIVASEACSQRVQARGIRGESITTRVLESEFAWIPVLHDRHVLGVRAVRRVDGRTVGDSGGLDAVLQAPAEERDRRVAVLLAESVRHFEVATAVNFNYPTYPLGYARADVTGGTRWSIRDGASSGTATLRFKEGDRTLVRTPDGRPIKAEGSFEVDRDTGRVLAASVTLNYAEAVERPAGVEIVHYEARVRFGDEPRLALWVPTLMEDRYEWRRRSAETGQMAAELIIEGRATYSGFRRFETGARVVP